MEHLATAVIILDVIDNDLLPDCLLSLPKWVKPLICKTQSGQAESLTEIRNDEHITLLKYEFTRILDFAKVRNLAKAAAETPWIISIDADERLDYSQHNYLRELLEKADEKIGGFMVTQWSFCSEIRDPDHPERCLRLAVPTVRIFRNLPPFTWRFAIHEVIEPSIIEAGYDILDTKINFLHEGYALSKERMKQKLERNIRAILNNPELFESKRYKDYLVNSCVMLKHLGGL